MKKWNTGKSRANLYYVKYPGGRFDRNSLQLQPNAPKPSWVIRQFAFIPDDPKYHHLLGKQGDRSLVNRKVPLISDEYVDMNFGTGALKVTPAHDINDYNLGLKHDLAVIDTLNEDGTLSEAAANFCGNGSF